MISRARHAPPLWTRWLVVALWMTLIFVMSAQPNSGEQSGALTRVLFQLIGGDPSQEQVLQVHHLLRKAAHFTEYGILAMLAAWAQPGLGLRRAFLTWGAVALYAASDEWHQSFVPNRGPAAMDVVIDSLGAATGLALWLVGQRRR